ncbi:helix-turn-helix domain-containing protein, partial [Streptococcus anginosus]
TVEDLKDILGPKQRQASWPFFDREIRQQHLACQLLLENPELTRQGLAANYGVSLATIQTDLKAVGEALLNYDLHLVRDDKKNYLVRGWEAERRQMLSSLLSQNIDEYTFFHPN